MGVFLEGWIPYESFPESRGAYTRRTVSFLGIGCFDLSVIWVLFLRASS